MSLKLIVRPEAETKFRLEIHKQLAVFVAKTVGANQGLGIVLPK